MAATGASDWVVHADLDAFFAAAEVLRRPELAGKPVIVGGSPSGRGVVSSASYEARAYGVRSAMPVARALRLCPDAVIVRPRGDHYRELSAQFRAILREFSPIVEVVSVDEAYLDASHSERLHGGPVRLGRLLKQRVHDETGLIVSLGIASNRLVAKIASDLGKPDGFTVVPHGKEAETLAPLPIERLPGIGPRAGHYLRRHGITTLGELGRAPEWMLQSVAGRHAETLRLRAQGYASRPVRSERDPQKSLGHERTFSRDLYGMTELRGPLFDLCERTGSELRERGLVAQVVTVKVRYDDFTTLTRQTALGEPTDAHQDMFLAAVRLLTDVLAERAARVRLIGVRASKLSPFTMQLGLFEHGRERTRNLNQALDHLAYRHGRRLLKPASVGNARPDREPAGSILALERR